MADPKDIRVDLLEIDMTVGKYWLDPAIDPKDKNARQAKRKAKDKQWLAEQKAKREAKNIT
jgi:hypothetical protein